MHSWRLCGDLLLCPRRASSAVLARTNWNYLAFTGGLQASVASAFITLAWRKGKARSVNDLQLPCTHSSLVYLLQYPSRPCGITRLNVWTQVLSQLFFIAYRFVPNPVYMPNIKESPNDGIRGNGSMSKRHMDRRAGIGAKCSRALRRTNSGEHAGNSSKQPNCRPAGRMLGAPHPPSPQHVGITWTEH
ncbi:hypothetical protein F4860DRAFT_204417 [Xylaria cubensis]|nr:hypothetical protein F4860DRAFT_204417 [Xylaria cubensis]